MLRESLSSKSVRAQQIMAGLQRAYPDAHCELVHSNPFELLIATILSAQCTDKQVNLVTEGLFKKYPTPREFAEADLASIEQDIKRIGLYRNKAKNIQVCCRQLLGAHGGQVPKTMEDLVALAGVGRKTANVVLGYAFGISHGIVVDTHVARLSARVGLTRETSPEKIETALQKLVPQSQWTMLSHWLIWHGRRRCFARSPDCARCEVKQLCPTGNEH